MALIRFTGHTFDSTQHERERRAEGTKALRTIVPSKYSFYLFTCTAFATIRLLRNAYGAMNLQTVYVKILTGNEVAFRVDNEEPGSIHSGVLLKLMDV